VRNNRGELIPLSHVIKITEKSRPQTISRTDRSRAIGITSNISQGASQSEIIKKIQDLAAKILPPEYHIVVSGSSKEFKESFSSLFFAFILGLVIAYMVLASQFNSFIHPFTVLVALPFSISGALIALAIGNQSINIYSMIGFILLMGIVKKNSILLVDFTNQYKEKGLSAKQALIESCPLRLRPILMTSFSTIAAAIPSALNLGPGAETRIPMALAVIGGVLISTLLTLAVVPCVYVLFSKKQNR